MKVGTDISHCQAFTDGSGPWDFSEEVYHILNFAPSAAWEDRNGGVKWVCDQAEVFDCGGV